MSRTIQARDSLDLLKPSHPHRSPPPTPSATVRTPPAGPATVKRRRSLKKVLARVDAALAHPLPTEPFDRPGQPDGLGYRSWVDAGVPVEKRVRNRSKDTRREGSSPELRTHSAAGDRRADKRIATPSRAASYPDIGCNVDGKHEPALKSGRWPLLGGWFGKKDPTPCETAASTPTRGSLANEDGHDSGGRARYERVPEPSRTLFRSRSRKDVGRAHFKRMNTVPIRTTDISQPLPMATEPQMRRQPFRGGFKPLLNVEIPNVELERYSIMFGNVLEDHSTLTSSSQAARRPADVERARSRPSEHDHVSGSMLDAKI